MPTIRYPFFCIVFNQLGDRAFGENLDPHFVITEFNVILLLQCDALLLDGADKLQPHG